MNNNEDQPIIITADKMTPKKDFLIEGIALVKLARAAKMAIADKKPLILVLDEERRRVVDCYEL